jgi:hypothetical protein
MTSRDSVDPMPLKHLGTPPTFTFAVEGHLYETNDGGRQFLVFTAGDGQQWSATEPEPGKPLGRYLVRAAADRVSCVEQLQRVVAEERKAAAQVAGQGAETGP